MGNPSITFSARANGEKMKKIAVIGCGNLLLGDDGFGPKVVRALKESGLEKILLVDAGVDETALVKALGKCDCAVIVDALVKKGAAPGELFEVDLSDGGMLDAVPATVPLGAHGIDVIHGLKIAKSIGNWPGKTVLVGTAPQKLDGIGLSAPAKLAVERAVLRIAEIATQ